MTDLSPAALAVWTVFLDHSVMDETPADLPALAAALRAAADRARRGPEHWEGSCPGDYDNGWNEALDYLTTIATELENHQ